MYRRKQKLPNYLTDEEQRQLLSVAKLEELCMYDLTRPLGQYLLDLERRVLAAGFPWKWHERPPQWWLESRHGQQFLFEMNKYAAPGPMCQGCEEQAARLCV